MQADGQGYASEQATLKQAGAFDGYGKLDTFNDAYDHYQVGNRAAGAVLGAGSAAAAAGAMIAGCSMLVSANFPPPSF